MQIFDHSSLIDIVDISSEFFMDILSKRFAGDL